MKHQIEIPQSMFVKALDEYVIGKNSKRNRDIMYQHLINGKTLEYLAEKHNLSREQIWNIIEKYLGIIIKHT